MFLDNALDRSAAASAAVAKSLQSCPTHRSTHTHTHTEVAQSCTTLCDPMDCSPPGKVLLKSENGILFTNEMLFVTSREKEEK